MHDATGYPVTGGAVQETTAVPGRRGITARYEQYSSTCARDFAVAIIVIMCRCRRFQDGVARTTQQTWCPYVFPAKLSCRWFTPAKDRNAAPRFAGPLYVTFHSVLVDASPTHQLSVYQTLRSEQSDDRWCFSMDIQQVAERQTKINVIEPSWISVSSFDRLQ